MLIRYLYHTFWPTASLHSQFLVCIVSRSVIVRQKPKNDDNNVEKHVMKFRDYLLFGHKKEGLEYAMQHGLWGHALFLASKMDDRSYSNVMLRFANGLVSISYFTPLRVCPSYHNTNYGSTKLMLCHIFVGCK